MGSTDSAGTTGYYSQNMTLPRNFTDLDDFLKVYDGNRCWCNSWLLLWVLEILWVPQDILSQKMTLPRELVNLNDFLKIHDRNRFNCNSRLLSFYFPNFFLQIYIKINSNYFCIYLFFFNCIYLFYLFMTLNKIHSYYLLL